MILVLWFNDKVIPSWRLQGHKDIKFHILEHHNDDFLNEDYCNLMNILQWGLQTALTDNAFRHTDFGESEEAVGILLFWFLSHLLSNNINTYRSIFIYVRIHIYIYIHKYIHTLHSRGSVGISLPLPYSDSIFSPHNCHYCCSSPSFQPSADKTLAKFSLNLTWNLILHFVASIHICWIFLCCEEQKDILCMFHKQK